MTLIIGSRGSQLALWQARWVAARLAELGIETELRIIRTTGDRITDVPLAKVGSKGLFTKEIEDALLAGEIDLAVHSLKDVPTVLPAGLTLAAIPERESPYDALIGHTLKSLSQGARVGTSSLRRSAQLRAARPDLRIDSVRGNLDTRLRKLDEGQYDAILLAEAGLRRLGWGERIAELMAPEIMCPAVGQGALAIETRDDGGDAFQACGRLDHAATRAAVTAERAVLRALGGGCQVPIGAHAEVDGASLRLRSVVIHPDGHTLLTDLCGGSTENAAEIGASSAERLLAKGAGEILAQVYGLEQPAAGGPERSVAGGAERPVRGPARPLAGRRVVVTRARKQAGTLADKLRALGAAVIELPVIDFVPIAFETPEWAEYQWAIFTSANSVEFFFDKMPAVVGPKICAIGPGTAQALRERGLEPDVMPEVYVAENVVAALVGERLAGKRVLLPRAAVARDVIPAELRGLGARVDVVAIYETVVPADLPEHARVALADPKPDWITLTSSSTVKHLLAAAGADALRGVNVASIGPVTSEVARRHGLTVAVEAERSTIEALVEAIAHHASSQANSTS